MDIKSMMPLITLYGTYTTRPLPHRQSGLLRHNFHTYEQST